MMEHTLLLLLLLLLLWSMNNSPFSTPLHSSLFSVFNGFHIAAFSVIRVTFAMRRE